MSRLKQDFPELSRPMSRPVRTRGGMVQRKMEDELMKDLDESTQPCFPGLGQPISRPVWTRGFCID